MKIKLIFTLIGIASSLYATECSKVYDKTGCEELSFTLGEGMSVSQYQVIYDGDQDGVRDSLDKCLNTPLKKRVDSNGCHHDIVEIADKEDKTLQLVQETQVAQVMTIAVNFDVRKSKIKEEYYGEVEKFANFLIENSEYKANIVGHTDSVGMFTDNTQLSKDRAKAVLKMLISLGVDSNRLSSDGVGPNEPIATNSTKEGRAQNRRIEVTLTKVGL